MTLDDVRFFRAQGVKSLAQYLKIRDEPFLTIDELEKAADLLERGKLNPAKAINEHDT